VASSLTGVVLICTKDSDIQLDSVGSTTRLVGDVLALLSALLYAGYVSLLKISVKDESRISMPLFFGFVGALNIMCFWPFAILLHFTGIEPFVLPSGKKVLAGLLLNGAITLVSDVIYLVAMLKTSPLVVTLGLSLTIPCAILGDLFKGTPMGGWRTYVGGIMVVIAFVVVGAADKAEIEEVQRGHPSPSSEAPVL